MCPRELEEPGDDEEVFEEELKNIVFLRWLWLVKITGKR